MVWPVRLAGEISEGVDESMMETTQKRNPNVKFDLAYLGVGVVLIAIMAVGIQFDIIDIMVLMSMTISLWLSVGAAMVFSRFNGGRWD